MTLSALPRKQSLGSGSRRTGLAAAAVVVAAIGTTAAPAEAQTTPLLLATEGVADLAFAYSADGHTFSHAVPELFDKLVKLAPGADMEEILWVRNDNDMTVDVSVAALAPTGAGETGRAGLTPSPVVTLVSGAAAPLNVRMWLPESADNSTQNQTWDVRLRVNAKEVVPAMEDELAMTGATSGIWPVSVAVLLGGAGGYLGARKRTQRS